MIINKPAEGHVIESNSARLQLLKQLAEFYTVSIGVDWTEVSGAMPKVNDDPEGSKYMAFLILFELWLTFDRFNLPEEKDEFCYRAKLLLKYKDFHKLPIGSLEYVYKNNCEDVDGRSE